ncbi:MAG: PrgI family protein [Patescibacteria group bacterium UBA2103]
MQYQVPQFIEVEDKIFGPFTLKQFIYLAGAAGISAVLFLSLPFFFALLLSIPFVGLGGALAFVKINNKPFIEVVESAFFFFTNGKLYLWEKKGVEARKEVQQAPVQQVQAPTPPPQEAMQKIRSLAQSLDIKDQNYGS